MRSTRTALLPCLRSPRSPSTPAARCAPRSRGGTPAGERSERDGDARVARVYRATGDGVVGGRLLPRDSIRQRLARDAIQVWLHRRRQAIEPQLDPRVEVEPRVLAQVLDRALELPSIALGAEVPGELRVDDHHEPLVVGDGRAGPRRREDLDLVRREGGITERDRAVAVDLERPFAGRGYDRRDRRPEPLADLRKERAHPPLHQLGVIADDLDRLDVEILR